MFGEILLETDESGVVNRPAGRGRIQDKAKAGVGRCELLPAIREEAIGNPIDRIGA